MKELYTNPESIFAPGNLVHGSSRMLSYVLPSYFDQGIVTASQLGRESQWGNPNEICFSILPNVDLETRYESISHYGPYQKELHNPNYSESYNRYRMAFIVSGEMVRQQFPDQAFAVGSHFWENSWLAKKLGVMLRKQEVYGFPVRCNKDAFSDELRVYPTKNKKNIVINPEMFLGLVVHPDRFDYLMSAIAEVTTHSQLPVFSPRVELLGFIGQ